MIHVTTRLKVDPEHLEAVISSLRSLLEPTRARKGCEGFRLLQDVTDVRNLAIVEQWRSREDFERYVRSPAYRIVLGSIEYANESPNMEIHEAQSSQGMELIRKIMESTPDKGGER